MDILNSALLDEINSTEILEEITDGNYDEFRNDYELLLAEVSNMSTGTNFEDDDEGDKNWE